MDRLLEGRNIVVTGANSSIDRTVVDELAACSANAWACVRIISDEVKVDTVSSARNNGIEVRPRYFGIMDADAAKAALKTIRPEKPRVDGLANVTGIVLNVPFPMTADATTHDVLEADFFAQMSITQQAGRQIQHGELIVNASSFVLLDANVGQTAHSSAKGAVATATKLLSGGTYPEGCTRKRRRAQAHKHVHDVRTPEGEPLRAHSESRSGTNWQSLRFRKCNRASDVGEGLLHNGIGHTCGREY